MSSSRFGTGREKSRETTFQKQRFKCASVSRSRSGRSQKWWKEKSLLDSGKVGFFSRQIEMCVKILKTSDFSVKSQWFVLISHYVTKEFSREKMFDLFFTIFSHRLMDKKISTRWEFWVKRLNEKTEEMFNNTESIIESESLLFKHQSILVILYFILFYNYFRANGIQLPCKKKKTNN